MSVSLSDVASVSVTILLVIAYVVLSVNLQCRQGQDLLPIQVLCFLLSTRWTVLLDENVCMHKLLAIFILLTLLLSM